ncbi:DUF4959 domain-containing protein [Chitinophaga lutea]
MRNLLIYSILLTTVIACKEDKLTPISKDGNAPRPVVAATVKSLPGGAQISYTLPDDPNLAYVRAEWEIQGVKREQKSSFYQRSLQVEGFGDTKEYPVKLYAVSYGEKNSAPLEVKIKPLPPSIDTVRRSLATIASFGGINTKFKNPDKANVMIGVLVWDDKQKEWKTVDNYYSAADSGAFSVRGLPAVEQKFGLYVRDRWHNRTDTFFVTHTPIPEVEIDKKTITDARKRNYPIPQRPPLPKSGARIQEPGNLSSWSFGNMLDGVISSGNGFHTTENKDVPIWMPIDLGKKVRLSRYKFWQRQGGFIYSHGNPHTWEIWGTNDPMNVDSWVLLDSRTLEKPSGSPLGDNKGIDEDAAAAGHEFELDINLPAVRYIAWKHIDNWAAIDGTVGFFHISELSIWGQIQ